MAAVLEQDYYETLKVFNEDSRYFPTVRAIPLTEMKDINGDGILEEVPCPLIAVDLNSRTITLPDEYKDFLSMEKDHRAENVYFVVDRYYEDVDLFRTTCLVEYVNAATPPKARLYPITLYDTESLKQEGKMIMAWCLGNEATEAAGKLEFALHFYTLNTDTRSLVYSLRTRPATGNILHGMHIKDKQLEEKQEYYNMSSNDFETIVSMIH
jgi:hypothetical protein